MCLLCLVCLWRGMVGSGGRRQLVMAPHVWKASLGPDVQMMVVKGTLEDLWSSSSAFQGHLLVSVLSLRGSAPY